MTPAQCRAARALLDWTQPHLAEAAGVSPSTLRDFESGKRIPIANNLAAIRAALETVGVTFLEDGDVAAGSGVAMHPTN
ncbi:helix-turn-helix transcriptional regulator [Sinorhizobium meliloti]|nr:helix-turn-helix transcriptional regulator [Sinorhizobium meliloti]MDE3825217.1 helix-turn-helix transcriptional regulator [Sinorhizobium meliloti]RVM45382.1 XRE family transcriptional regulator [Sinorhizobium meliloti]RVN65666.1 XRE family transcriptional regulator [Sinorhizobium meliloti]